MAQAMVKQRDLVEVTICDMGMRGEGIAKLHGYTLFVEGGVTGDRLRVRVQKANASYGFAKIEEILTPSPLRAKPACPQFASCGGCSLMHLSYQAQLAHKMQMVQNNIRKIGGYADDAYELEPILGAEHMLGYRNKAQFPVAWSGKRAVMGFYAQKSHKVVPTNDCKIQDPAINAAAQACLGYINRVHLAPYDETNGTGEIRHICIRRLGKEMAVVLVTKSGRPLPNPARLIEALKRLGATSILQNINPARTNVVLGEETRALYGTDKLHVLLDGLQFEVSVNSFFQVHTHQAERLYQKAVEYAGLCGRETVFDLYCGAGTISLFMARHAGSVVGIELVPEAVENARKNAAQNGILNAAFYAGDCADVVERLARDGTCADVVVVDPPRKGCPPKLLSLILKMAPKKLVYVSCNSATLARDLQELKKAGLVLCRLTPVDMFPQTSAVESVALLKNAGTIPQPL